MKSKTTIAVIGKEDNCIYGNCIKEFLHNDHSFTTIIMSSCEFSSYYKNVLKEKLSLNSMIFREGKDIIESNLIKFNVDKIIKDDTTFYSKKTRYINMMNMFIRFNPQVVVMTDCSVIVPCVATIKRLFSSTKTVVCIDDFVLDKRFINSNVDLYIVQNLEIKNSLLENGIQAERIALSDIPSRKEFYSSPSKEETSKLLGVNLEHPTVLIVKSDFNDDYLKKLETSELVNSFNFISVIDDDNADLNVPFSCADIIITHPQSKTLVKGLIKNKLIFTYYPKNILDKRNALYLDCDVTVYNKDYAELESNLKKYSEDSSIFNSKVELTVTYGNNPISEIVKLIKNVIS